MVVKFNQSRYRCGIRMVEGERSGTRSLLKGRGSSMVLKIEFDAKESDM